MFLQTSSRPWVFSFFGVAFFLLLFSAPLLAAEVTLAWDAPDDPAVSGYKIYAGLSGSSYKDQPDLVINDASQTSCTLSGLLEGEEYAFSATSFDTYDNESDFSNEVLYTIPLSLQAPQNLRFEN